MYNNNRNHCSQLAHSIQRDYQQDAEIYRLAKASNSPSNFGKTAVSKSLRLASYAIFFVTLFALFGGI